MAENDTKETEYYLKLSILFIIYNKIINLRSRLWTKIIADELIENEEKALVTLAQCYVLQQTLDAENESEECYLNISNIFKLINSSDYIIKAFQHFQTKDIVSVDMVEIKTRFFGRIAEPDVSKFIKALEIVKYVIHNKSDKEFQHLTNDYEHESNTNTKRLYISLKLTPRPSSIQEEILDSSNSPTTLNCAIVDDANCFKNPLHHDFAQKHYSFFVSCNVCNKFGFHLLSCKTCEMKIHETCISRVEISCLEYKSSQISNSKSKVKKIVRMPALDQSNNSLDSSADSPHKNTHINSIKNFLKEKFRLKQNSDRESTVNIFERSRGESLSKSMTEEKLSSPPRKFSATIENRHEKNANQPTKKVSRVGQQDKFNKKAEFLKSKRGTIVYDWIISLDEINLGAFKYKSRFGSVYIADWHGEKMLTKFSEENCDPMLYIDFRIKIDMLRKTRHDNLALFICACIEPSFAVITEYIYGVNLYTKIHEEEMIFDIDTFDSIGIQILHGLSYLHSKNIVHMNLTSKSVFFSLDKRIKLTDFGMVTPENQKKYISCTTYPEKGLLIPKVWLYYQPREILKILNVNSIGSEVRKYDIKTDIYAFGIILYELVTGVFPRQFETAEEIIYQVSNNIKFDFNDSEETQNPYFINLMKLIKKCLESSENRFDNTENILNSLKNIPKKHILGRTPSQPLFYNNLSLN